MIWKWMKKLNRLKGKKLSNNKDISMTDFRKRRKKLEDDLETLEGNFEDRLSGVQKRVMGALEPLEYIKRNPFKAVGASIFIGFTIGKIGKDKSSGEGESVHQQQEKMFNLFFNEIKRVAARKAATYFSEFIDEKISKQK